MSAARTIAFNRLPAAVRNRFTACIAQRGRPLAIVAAAAPLGSAGGLWTLTALLAATVAAVTLTLATREPHVIELAIAGSVLAACSVASFLAARRASWRRDRSPYRWGRYLFPTYFVEATADRLRLIPMRSMIDCHVVHHQADGEPTHSEITLTFEGEIRESFIVRNKREAAAIVRDLHDAIFQVERAVRDRDLERAEELDVFFELRIETLWDSLSDAGTPSKPAVRAPVVPELPAWLRGPAVAAAAVCAGGGTMFGLMVVMGVVVL